MDKFPKIVPVISKEKTAITPSNLETILRLCLDINLKGLKIQM